MSNVTLLILACSLLAFIAAIYYARKVMSVNISGTDDEVSRFNYISGAIEDGAKAFLSAEYKYVGIFCLFFSILIYFFLLNKNLYVNTILSTISLKAGWISFT